MDNQTAILASKYVNSTDKDVFLTGKAGTGKTTFLKKLVETTHKNVIIAAPTGVAAINAGGVTLHSLFQLPFGSFIPDNNFVLNDRVNLQINTPKSLLSGFQMNKNKRKLLREMELLIIDEVSMCRADLIDMIDAVLRHVRRIQKPFGGVQVLFIGDLQQLPPIVKDDELVYLNRYYSSMYFFDAHVLSHKQPIYLELSKVYRQSDLDFVNLLNHVRDNKISSEDISLLNQYYNSDIDALDKKGYIYLTTHNNSADGVNKKELDKIDELSLKYEAIVSGDFNEWQYPVEETLELKVGAQVMFIKNDYSGEHRYYNGKIGIIAKLTPSSIWVEPNDSAEWIEVEPYVWENKKFFLNKVTGIIEEQTVGTFKQFPLRLAWAITIHKSQGLTFEKAIIDVGRAFAPGQVYVALSRLRSLSGLVLNAPFKPLEFFNEKALENFAQTKKSESDLQIEFSDESRRFVGRYLIEAFNFDGLDKDIYDHYSSYSKSEGRSSKQKHKSWAKNISDEFHDLAMIAEKFQKQLNSLMFHKSSLDQVRERTEKAIQFFSPGLKNLIDAVHTQRNALRSESGVKKYISELSDLSQFIQIQHQKLHRAKALLDSTLLGEELTRQEILSMDVFKEAIEKGKKEAKKIKEKKIPTATLTCSLFMEGKSVNEIVLERKLTKSTILGHLAVAVEEGKVSVEEFISKEKYEHILAVYEKQEDKNSLGQLKRSLGDEISYSDIKLSLAHKTFLESQTEPND